MKRLEQLAIAILPPLFAASIAMTFALEAKRPAPLTHYYELLRQPLAYRCLILPGAAGLGICVLFLFAKLLEFTDTMSLDRDPRPWWAVTRTVTPVAVASVVLCATAQLFRVES